MCFSRWIGGTHVIALNNIVIKYGDFTAVHDLSLRIEDGEFFTFLGPSGCGKTTTLRAIAGFEKPTSGSITAFGKDLSGMLPEERDLGFVFQNYALFPADKCIDFFSKCFGLCCIFRCLHICTQVTIIICDKL